VFLVIDLGTEKIKAGNKIATISRGYSFGATEQVTNAKLHALVDSATISGIVNADIDASAGIVGTKLADVDGGKLTGLANISSAAGKIPAANLPIVDTYATKGANSDITSLSGLTTPLSVPQGGTGITSYGTAGQYLKSKGDGVAPEWGTVQSAVAGGFTNMQAFTTSGTWTKPANVNKVYVKVWGGGGGCYAPSNNTCGGGGGGGYSEGLIEVTGNVTVTIGAGGTGNAPGANGGTSSFAGASTIQATGGTKATYVSNGQVANGGAGGVGSNGSLNLTGTTGGTGYGGTFGGDGGNAPFMSGAGYGAVTSATATNAIANSGGGAGGGIGDTSLDGGSGLVLVYWNQ